jgi:ABC-type glycerol-3-phosphate transport system permease component
MADIAGTSTSKAGRIASRTGTYVLLIVVAFVCIVPFYVDDGQRDEDQPGNQPWSLDHAGYSAGRELADADPEGGSDPNTGLRSGGLDVPRGFFNSVVVALSSTLLAAYFSALTAYGFAMYRFRGQGLLFGLILSVIMLPPTIMLVGLFKLSLTLNLYDHPADPHSARDREPVYRLLPAPVHEERSSIRVSSRRPRIDGAGEFLIFHKVGLPLVLPGIATMSIFGFLVQWNNYLVPLTLLNSSGEVHPATDHSAAQHDNVPAPTSAPCTLGSP